MTLPVQRLHPLQIDGLLRRVNFEGTHFQKLVVTVTQTLTSFLVRIQEATFQVLNENGILGIVEQGSKLFLAPAQRLLSLLSFHDLANESR